MVDSNLYTSSYYESFCVSGDNVSCWSCFDNIMNDDETYPDWGGHCGSSIGVKCNNNRLDNVTFETSIDYGGSCGNCSGNVLNDTSYFILKDSGLITYPFNQSLCQESEEIVGGVVSFVLVLAGILIVPVLLLLVFLVVLFIFALFGLFGVTFGGLFGKFRNKGKKDGKNDDYS
jgi:hypothetical protein